MYVRVLRVYIHQQTWAVTVYIIKTEQYHITTARSARGGKDIRRKPFEKFSLQTKQQCSDYT